MVPFMSSSSGAPWRANLRRRRRAILMLRVPSSTESSRFLYSRLSQTLIALPWRPLSWPMRMPSGWKPLAPNGEVPFLPRPPFLPSSSPSPSSPSSCCSFMRWASISISFSKPPISSIIFHQGGTRQIIEVLDRVIDHVLIQRLHQHEVLFQRHRHFGLTKLGEEV